MADYDSYDDKDISKYNQAGLKMIRLNEINQIINESKMNLVMINPTWKQLNVYVYFKAVKTYYGEVFIKFSEEEKAVCESLRIGFEKLDREYPITYRNKSGVLLINEPRLVTLTKLIEKYEMTVKEFSEQHGFDTPNMEDEDGE